MLSATGCFNMVSAIFTQTRFQFKKKERIKHDGFVKSPHAALRRILRHCSVPQSTLHSSGFARLA